MAARTINERRASGASRSARAFFGGSLFDVERKERAGVAWSISDLWRDDPAVAGSVGRGDPLRQLGRL
jgi:hypothetical protein